MIKDISETATTDITKNNLRVLIDWLSFTFSPGEDFTVTDAVTFLGFHTDDFIRASKGASGYRTMHLYNGANIRVLSDGKPDMGIHVDVSGSAVPSLLYAWQKKNTCNTPFGETATMYSDFGYALLLDMLDALSGIATFTRLDLAIDDIGCSYYSCDDISRLAENQQVISRFKKFEIRNPRTLSDGTKKGHTVYFGSRKSEIMLRIYDKKLEQIGRNIDCPYEWIRWELELKGDRAKRAVQLLLDTHSISMVCMGILNHYIRFIVKDNPVRGRCTNEPVWDAFLEDAENLSLYIPEDTKTVEDTKRWIDKYVGASLSLVIEADGGCMDFIYKNLYKWRIRRMRNRNLTKRLQQAIKTLEKEQKLCQ